MEVFRGLEGLNEENLRLVLANSSTRSVIEGAIGSPDRAIRQIAIGISPRLAQLLFSQAFPDHRISIMRGDGAVTLHLERWQHLDFPIVQRDLLTPEIFAQIFETFALRFSDPAYLCRYLTALHVHRTRRKAARSIEFNKLQKGPQWTPERMEAALRGQIGEMLVECLLEMFEELLEKEHVNAQLVRGGGARVIGRTRDTPFALVPHAEMCFFSKYNFTVWDSAEQGKEKGIECDAGLFIRYGRKGVLYVIDTGLARSMRKSDAPGRTRGTLLRLLQPQQGMELYALNFLCQGRHYEESDRKNSHHRWPDMKAPLWPMAEAIGSIFSKATKTTSANDIHAQIREWAKEVGRAPVNGGQYTASR